MTPELVLLLCNSYILSIFCSYKKKTKKNFLGLLIPSSVSTFLLFWHLSFLNFPPDKLMIAFRRYAKGIHRKFFN